MTRLKRGDIVRYFRDPEHIEFGLGVVHQFKIRHEDLIANIILGRSSFDYWKGNKESLVLVYWTKKGHIWQKAHLLIRI